MQRWHRFKERLIGELHSDSQSRLVVQASAQLCIPRASRLPLFHLRRLVCVCMCVR